MTCLAYADDVLLFADSLEKLVCMFNDCCASFERAGLAVGAEKTVVLNGMLMRAGEHDVLWERTFTFVGCELEPSGHSGAALAHRIVKANGVFSAWRPILLNPNIPLRARAEAFGISVASSLLWQAGNRIGSCLPRRARGGTRTTPLANTGNSCTVWGTKWRRASRQIFVKSLRSQTSLRWSPCTSPTWFPPFCCALASGPGLVAAAAEGFRQA